MRAPHFDGSQPCAQSGGDSWFPEDNAFTTENRLAIAICKGCSFNIPCLEYALANNPIGIWGGTTVKERSAIKRQRRGAA